MELMEEQKEIKLENNDLKQQVQEMKLKLIDVNDYENWDTQQMVFWIVSLDDARFKKYEDISEDRTLLAELTTLFFSVTFYLKNCPLFH